MSETGSGTVAVYTDVSDEALRAFLREYELGDLLSYKGIAEGVENSNFFLHTSTGNYILTLYEKRVNAADLPFFINLMGHLARAGLACPQPVRNRAGTALGHLCGRPAAIVNLPRRRVVEPPERRALPGARRCAGGASRRRPRFSDGAREQSVGGSVAPALRAG
ncbi:UNVERIFIED_ORG: homoserine kinase [Methylorubrum zatmanii]|nr:homoserine kinase [Methylorubrum zatmanii]